MQELFCEAELKRSLGALSEQISVRLFETCDSTNAEARRMALAGERRPVLIAAAHQTAGRGRLGRQFHSPDRTGVYLSLLYPLKRNPSSAVSVTSAAAVAVMRAIRETTGKQTEIKWVNDLYYRDRKVCGILAESFSLDGASFLVLGVGINLRPCAFPPELSDIAGSLGDTETPRCTLIASVLRELWWAVEHPDDRAWLSDYRAHSLVLGKRVRWIAGERTGEGIAEGINENGELLVRDASGALAILRTGEISVRLTGE